MKKVPKWQWGVLAGVLLSGTVALATLPKVWTAETLRYSDLNANFAHVEAALRGGTHTAITNADLSASAVIAHSKLATPALVPRIFGFVWSATPCDGATSATCTIVEDVGISSVVGTGTDGRYTVTFDTPRLASNYAVLVTATTAETFCWTTGHLAATVDVRCGTRAAADQDSNFSIMIMDTGD